MSIFYIKISVWELLLISLEFMNNIFGEIDGK